MIAQGVPRDIIENEKRQGYQTQRQNVDNSVNPNIHVFNVNLTNGYSEEAKSTDDSKDRLAFAAEVEAAYNQDLSKMKAAKHALGSGKFNQAGQHWSGESHLDQQRNASGGGDLGFGSGWKKQ